MNTYIDLAPFALMAHLSEHGSDPAILAALGAGCMPFPLHGSSVLVH